MVEKVINVEVKTNLQLPSRTREIDSRCSKGYRLLVKKDKDDANQKYRDETLKNKAKSHNFFSTNQPQTLAPMNDKRDCRGGHPTTEVNATEIAKKDKDKANNFSHIKCYTYK